MSERGDRAPRLLVVDTSVAIKFYIPEEGHEDALRLLEAANAGSVELVAPDIILAEGFSAISRQQRREILDEEDALKAWRDLLSAPIYTYATGDLIERAAELYYETGAIIYDALFLALAEESSTVMVTADGRLLKTLEGTPHVGLARDLAVVDALIP